VAFGQHLDVRHGAREGARLAAVNYAAPGAESAESRRDAIIAATCDRMDSSNGSSVSLHRPGASGVGQTIEVRVRKPLNQLTGFLGFALNGVTLESSVDIRIEQTAQWQNMAADQFQGCP
jgi:3-oxoacyl-ACP reductase-like protein